MQNYDPFKLVLPAELIKSEDGEWRIRGLATTEAIDQQGEIVLQKGMDLSPIEQQKGIINWDHNQGPQFTIGVLDNYAKTNGKLFVEGRLFKKHTLAKAVKEIMDSLGEKDRGRIGISVEGGIVRRNAKNPKIIEKSIVTGVALTMNPVNTQTYAELMKSLTAEGSEIEFAASESVVAVESSKEPQTFTAEQVAELVKALGVGSGYIAAPNTLTGGAALAQSGMEKLEKDEKPEEKESGEDLEVVEAPEEKIEEPKNYYTKKAGLKKSLVDLLDRLQKLYPENSRLEIWNAVQDRINTKFPAINAEWPQ